MAEIILTEQVSIVTLSGICSGDESRLLSALFSSAAEENIIIDMISKAALSTDKTSVGFTFNDEDMPKMLRVIGKINVPKAPLVSCGNMKITIKSYKMANETGVAARFFNILSAKNVTPLLITTAVDEISAVLRAGDADEVIKNMFIIFNANN